MRNIRLDCCDVFRLVFTVDVGRCRKWVGPHGGFAEKFSCRVFTGVARKNPVP